MNDISVMIVDDHPLFRQGVVDSVSFEHDLDVIGEASNGDDALTMIQELQPDVVILDVNLPGMNGLQVTRSIRSKGMPTRVILVTAYDDAEQVVHAMRLGAAAYCPKQIRPEDLVEIIRHVVAGKLVVGGGVLEERELDQWLKKYIEEALGFDSDPGEPLHPLSPREMEVLSYVSQGMSNKEIAALLGISYQTVKNHVTSVLRKLRVDDRTQATVYALRRGWFRIYDQGTDAADEDA
ncbi:MAG: response regulator transcription factor [Thermodesulfobacteriota bacterium]|nr:response regulator transcription factor [Thermodesulfobacteriota bacterium]